MNLRTVWSRPYLHAGGEESVFLLIEIVGKGRVWSDRAPINLSLVLDRSGSMAGTPLDYSLQSCEFAVDQLTDEDILSLVAFDDESATILTPEHVKNKDYLKQRIRTVQSGGCTNLSDGLLEGAKHVRRNLKKGMTNRVILLSDGHANRGITDPKKLHSITTELRSSGMSISTMGIGDRFDEELMEAIAEHGGGNFFYIDTPERIPEIFRKEFDGLFSLIVQNMKLIVMETGSVKVKSIHGFPCEKNTSGCCVYAGDLYNEEVKTILVELEAGPMAEGKHSVLGLTLEYVDVTGGAADCTITCKVQAEFTTDTRLLDVPTNPEVQKHVELASTAQAIERALEEFDCGNEQAGVLILHEQAVHMHIMSDLLADPLLAQESVQLAKKLQDFEYTSRMRKELHEQKYRNLKLKG